MSEVKLSIGDREYTVACAPGEEAHVSALGLVIDTKVRQLGEGATSVEAQKLLFGALFLADELHEAKKAADAGKAAQDSAIHEAAAAISERDDLNQTVTKLQAELEGLQLAQKSHAAEMEEVRTEITQRREESEECRSELEKATAHVAELEQERTNLAGLLEEALSAPAPAAIPANLIDDPDLAPALERFADLLETCADKLEAGTTNP